jgi:hypothetical protein
LALESLWVVASPHSISLPSCQRTHSPFPWRDKSFLRSKLVSAISLLFRSIIFLYSSSSFCVLACSSSTSSIFFLRSLSSPWTAVAASAASCSRRSLSFYVLDLEDVGVVKPTLFRNWFELF